MWKVFSTQRVNLWRMRYFFLLAGGQYGLGRPSMTVVALLLLVGASKWPLHSSTKSVPVTACKHRTGCWKLLGGNRRLDVGVVAEKEESVWNVLLRHVPVCACTIAHVWLCHVAEAFEAGRGLRGMVARWRRRMYGPLLQVGCDLPGVRVHSADTGEDVCFEEMIYHGHLE